MQTGVSRLKEPFTPLREEDWDGGREDGVKPQKHSEPGGGPHRAIFEDETKPGSNGRVEPWMFS